MSVMERVEHLLPVAYAIGLSQQSALLDLTTHHFLLAYESTCRLCHSDVSK